MKDHKRNDIFSMMSNHEIGYHTNFHSRHPLIVEYLESLGFKEGALEFEKGNQKGLKI